MYRMDQKEVDRISRIVSMWESLQSKRMIFRYGKGGECRRFEERYAKKLGVKYCTMTASGTYSIAAALIGLEIGPGDEVLVPACTYMATALGVLAAGAIPVIVDIDESITMDPDAVDAAVGSLYFNTSGGSSTTLYVKESGAGDTGWVGK